MRKQFLLFVTLLLVSSLKPRFVSADNKTYCGYDCLAYHCTCGGSCTNCCPEDYWYRGCFNSGGSLIKCILGYQCASGVCPDPACHTDRVTCTGSNNPRCDESLCTLTCCPAGFQDCTDSVVSCTNCVAPTPTPFYWRCSGTSCVMTANPAGKVCWSGCSNQSWGAWSSCPSGCGTQTMTRTCNCTGDCCTGCSDGEGSGGCGATGTKTCCNECVSCSPSCGQSRNCSSACSDLRSGVVDAPANIADPDVTVTHDLTFRAAGWACDKNVSGATGVAGIHLYEGAAFKVALSQNTNRADTGCGALLNGFDHNVTANSANGLYIDTANKTGYTDHTLIFWAADGSGGCSGSWQIGTRVIRVTNSAPTNTSISPNSGDILSYGGPSAVPFTAIFRDTNSVPAGRTHDVRYGKVRFGTTSDNSIVEVTYSDDTDTVTISGGTQSGNVAISNTSSSAASGNLTVRFTLDFSSLPTAAGGAYNLYLQATDWAGAATAWQDMGDLEIWNGTDVNVSGRVYDITSYYPNETCANLADPTGGIDTPAITFTRTAGPGTTVTANADGSGNYSTTLAYGTTYLYSLSKADYFTTIMDAANLGGACITGQEGLFTVSDGPNAAGVDFGMGEVKSPWIQVVGGAMTSYSGININIPSTCGNDYNDGGDCLPYISVNRYQANDSDLFSENGLVATKTNILSGDALGVGIPNDWQVEDASLWRLTGGWGFDYYRNLLGKSFVTDGDQDLKTMLSCEDVPCAVGVGETAYLLVDGNLTIDKNLTVASGGLAILVASGNIVISGDVANAEGVFIADGSVQIQSSTADQAMLEGIFVADADADGNGSVASSRDLGVDNNLFPATVFTYRPDLLVTMLEVANPSKLMEREMRWEEVKP